MASRSKLNDDMFEMIKENMWEIYRLNKLFGGNNVEEREFEPFIRERLDSSKILRYDKKGLAGYITYHDFFEDRVEILHMAIRNNLRRTYGGVKMAISMIDELSKTTKGRPLIAWFLKVEHDIIDYARRLGFSFIGDNYYQVCMRREV